jgi:hypothetical protein
MNTGPAPRVRANTARIVHLPKVGWTDTHGATSPPRHDAPRHTNDPHTVLTTACSTTDSWRCCRARARGRGAPSLTRVSQVQRTRHMHAHCAQWSQTNTHHTHTTHPSHQRRQQLGPKKKRWRSRWRVTGCPAAVRSTSPPSNISRTCAHMVCECVRESAFGRGTRRSGNASRGGRV